MVVKIHMRLYQPIEDFRLRCDDQKLRSVQAFQSVGYDTIAVGDSHNDLSMMRASKAGFLFNTTEALKAANPDIPAYDDYAELLAAIKNIAK